jgi:hypothetical protein
MCVIHVISEGRTILKQFKFRVKVYLPLIAKWSACSGQTTVETCPHYLEKHLGSESSCIKFTIRKVGMCFSLEITDGTAAFGAEVSVGSVFGSELLTFLVAVPSGAFGAPSTGFQPVPMLDPRLLSNNSASKGSALAMYTPAGSMRR